MTASSNIPNSISPEDLEKLAQAAAPEVTAPETDEPLYDGMTEEAIHDLVGEKLMEISEACGHPVSHKLACMIVFNNMIDWHKRMSQSMMESGDFDAAAGWSRDAGKFQAIMNILFTIEVGNDDFTVID